MNNLEIFKILVDRDIAAQKSGVELNDDNTMLQMFSGITNVTPETDTEPAKVSIAVSERTAEHLFNNAMTDGAEGRKLICITFVIDADAYAELAGPLPAEGDQISPDYQPTVGNGDDL